MVWISSALADSELILPLTHDLWVDDRPKAMEAEKLLKKGMPVPKDACPKRIWGKENAGIFASLPALFCAEGHYIASEEPAHILHQFELGSGAVYPITEGVHQKDDLTRVPGQYFCWIFGNVKRAFLEGQSPSAPALVNDERDWCGMPVVMEDGDIAVSASALSGPDVWIDPTLFKSIFLSGPLGQALIDAGLGQAFRLKRCRVVQGA